MRSRLRSLWFGLSLPARAFRLILSKPKLIALSILPAALTFALYSLVILRVQDQAKLVLNQAFVGWGMDPKGWIAWSALLLARLLLFLVGALTFSLMASIVAAPLNDLLAELSEPHSEWPLKPVPSQGLSARFRLIGIDLVKAVVATGANLVAILFSWVPLLNFVALLATFLLVCFQYISYPATRRGEGVHEGFMFLWRHFYACLGFGAVAAILYAVPILSSLFLPVAVVGGTMLYARAKAPGEALR